MGELKGQNKTDNATKVLNSIRSNPGISRINCAKLLGLNRSTLTYIVNNLLKDGWIEETKPSSLPDQRGGRRAIGLALNRKKGLVLGLEWQIDRLCYVLADLNGQVILQDLESFSGSVDQLSLFIKELIERLEGQFHLSILGISLALPGLIDSQRGVVVKSLAHDLIHFPLVQFLAEKLSKPIIIENDANCFAWGEITHSDSLNFICLMLELHSLGLKSFRDSEIGMGIVINQRVYKGHDFMAGEFSAPFVDSELKEKFQRVSLIKEGERSQENKELIRGYFRALLRALTPVFSALSPEYIVLGGGFIDFKPLLKELFSELGWSNRFTFSSKGVYEVSVGAIGHFLEEFFSSQDHPIQWEHITNEEL